MNATSQDAPSRRSITDQYEAIAEAACDRLAKNKRVRRNLPGGGRLRIDRQLPFLCLHRGNEEDAVTRELITSEAAYLFASDSVKHHEGLSHLCSEISAAMQEHFGTFLLIEVWAKDLSAQRSSSAEFQIACIDGDAIPSTINAFEEALKAIRVDGRPPQVNRLVADVAELRGLPSLASVCPENGSGACCTLGLIVNPFYRDRVTGAVYPVALQVLRSQLAIAFRKTVAEFTGNPKGKHKAHYDTLGPSSMVKAARLIDQQLCEVSGSFDFLLQVTPTNADEARMEFAASSSKELPSLRYRHLPYHPNILKRRLFDIEIERVEDPTLAHLFWEKQDEIDRQLTSLRDLHAPELALHELPKQSHFLTSSLQLYGTAEDSLVELAEQILERFAKAPPASQDSASQRSSGKKKCVDSEELASAAREEIDRYHTRMNEFTASVELSDTIASGIMVSHDRLLISREVSIPRRRLAPLLHHEVGTHLLTYFNGRCQPFRQLYAGLAGYEELQEGLAVLAEYLVGGLTRMRIRTLAARVMAVHWMVNGKSFASVVNRLQRHHRFSRRQSFTTTLRVFRGGGLTKDIIYLRGLRDLLDYLAKGHDIEPLYVGKIGLQHVPYIQELRRRGIITPPRILPRFLDDESARDRLEACRGKSVLDLMETD
ncbi:flavohemoglobin expression-modulating QEGLA motif protein [Aporhodopirellula aestuarii]|uniref:Flavohemoglobin expression-modulating QEGLA motif protein n=1 Tax=Aporhodopirellula aestuarii TaxID=2950107 RepID=A0ABT0U9T5_9BACT|nr:flavohemoglobin expression-modulating QEGLA motif protein [Aporhodopirellula aestuarii]MCM2373653.1 flavohemoglobin expression-modulating QEGLA motif protein [Aporhodopirellula aestuarii]